MRRKTPFPASRKTRNFGYQKVFCARKPGQKIFLSSKFWATGTTATALFSYSMPCPTASTTPFRPNRRSGFQKRSTRKSNGKAKSRSGCPANISRTLRAVFSTRRVFSRATESYTATSNPKTFCFSENVPSLPTSGFWLTTRRTSALWAHPTIFRRRGI